jgi:hypothetical protein
VGAATQAAAAAAQQQRRQQAVARAAQGKAAGDLTPPAPTPQAFGRNIKLGLIEDSANRDALAKLVRLRSSASGEGTTGLDAYVARKKEGQKHIYYLAGECSVFYGCFGLRGLRFGLWSRRRARST